jgi:hypothetical protein
MLLATEIAEIRITAFKMDGSTGIPALTMPMTHGEAAAPAPPLNSLGSSYGTIRPTANDPST